MVTYFAKRVVGGIFTLFAFTLAMFTLFTYGPGGIQSDLSRPCLHCFCRDASFDEQLKAFYHIDKPWPVSYLAWLFDLEGPKPFPLCLGTETVTSNLPASINLEIGGLRLGGSGILTGNLGVSTDVKRGQLVTDMFGRGAGEIILLMLLVLFVSMGIVIIQRRARPPMKDLPYSSRQPVTRGVSYRTSATNELFRVQFGGVYSI